MSNIRSCFGGYTKPANDELYTPESTAEYVLDKYGYLLENKKIILPCDQEWSELYKACKRRGLDCDIAQDMYNVDYSKYDICFTNPPFRSLCKYIRFLLDKGVKFLLFAPWSIVIGCAAISSEKQIKAGKFHPFYHNVYYIGDFKRTYTTFIRPDGSEYGVHWGLVTNLEEGKTIVESKPDIRIEATDDFQHYKGICCDLTKCNYLKYDYVLHPRLMVKKRSDDRVKTFKETI